MMGWINSTATARLNGYVGGYASVARLAEEIDRLGLSSPSQEYLWEAVRCGAPDFDQDRGTRAGPEHFL